MKRMEWYEFEGMEQVNSPALIIYKSRVLENIRLLKTMVDSVSRLRPHVKTHKMREVTELLMEEGIDKFKCATVAEAEMIAISGAKDILIAYQLVGPKIDNYINLVKRYPKCRFSSLVDNFDSYNKLQLQAHKSSVELSVYIDLNVGMNRTGLIPGLAQDLYLKCIKGSVPVLGFHLYDGHINYNDILKREEACEKSYKPVQKVIEDLAKLGFSPLVIAGGTLTFPFHKKRENVECSPGTFVFWDRGYQQICIEQSFLPAALILTRVISIPQPSLYCLDLGYKSIASESSLDYRAFLLYDNQAIVTDQSEEHMVVELSKEKKSLEIGKALFVLPYHICPTVAMYDFGYVVEENRITEKWKILPRDRSF